MLKQLSYKLGKKNERYPWDQNLFKNLNNHNEKLEKERMEIFHTFFAKGLFLAKQGRPDIKTRITYLSTKLRKLNESDWVKLTNFCNS
jgi:hypothetical protein